MHKDMRDKGTGGVSWLPTRQIRLRYAGRADGVGGVELTKTEILELLHESLRGLFHPIIVRKVIEAVGKNLEDR